MLFNEDFNGREGVVVHFRVKMLCLSLNNHMLVDFVVSAGRVDPCQFFIASKPVAEQPEVPIRVVGMSEPFSHKHKATVDPIASGFFGVIGRDLSNFLLRCGWKHFVRIHDEHPFVAER